MQTLLCCFSKFENIPKTKILCLEFLGWRQPPSAEGGDLHVFLLFCFYFFISLSFLSQVMKCLEREVIVLLVSFFYHIYNE